MKTIEVKLSLPEIDGFEYTGEYRPAVAGEPVLVSLGATAGPTALFYPILRKIEKWRPATVEDAIRALQGKSVEVRCWDNAGVKVYGYLESYVKGLEYPWYMRSIPFSQEFKHCEVKE